MLAFEKRWVALTLEGFSPPGGPGLAPRPGEVDYLDVFCEILRHSTPLSRIGMRFALWLTVTSPIWLERRLRLLPTLAVQERSLLLDRLLENPHFIVREMANLLKMGACLALLGAPSVRARCGYERSAPRWQEAP